MFSPMQKQYLYEATHRWNVKSGATRSGKTYLDYYVIPKRIKSNRGKDGLNVFLGNTRGTLQRNIIEPLQNIWGERYVSDIKSDNTATVFGEKVYCLGADKKNQVDKIRGSSIKYCYGDEVVTWSQDVFDMLKSRLDKSYSRFDGTCNPDNPHHWFKKFIDNDEIDIYLQHYTIDDNPFLPEAVKDNLKREYFGTVFYDRYILGKWTAAEGLIYRQIADDAERFMIDKDKLPPLYCMNVGEDFGQNKSGHSIVCSGMGTDGKLYFTHAIYKKAAGTKAEDVIDWSCETINRIHCDTDYKFDVYPDCAEQTYINSLRAKLPFSVYNSLKKPIIDRIRFLTRLISADRVRFVRGETEVLVEALSEATWDDKSLIDKRLDNYTFNNDIIDAAEYSFEINMKRMVV